MKNNLIQFAKFFVVGIIAFIVDYFFFWLFAEILYFHPVLSTGLSFLISLIFNFILSMKFVFVPKEGLSKKKQILIFVITSVIGLFLNMFIMYIGYDLLKFNELIIKIIATGIVMIWNYVSKKLLLEKRK